MILYWGVLDVRGAVGVPGGRGGSNRGRHRVFVRTPGPIGS